MTSGFNIYNEPIVYSSSTTSYLLQYSVVQSILSVVGEVSGATNTFVVDIDYRLDNGALLWLQNGTKPDNLSTYYVSYKFAPTVLSLVQAIYDRLAVNFPEAATDSGSVLRTLVNAVMSSVVDLYEYMSTIQGNAYIGSAEGTYLDRCVEILGITREAATKATGHVTFSRTTTSAEDITIPIGTVISTTPTYSKGAIYFTTTTVGTITAGNLTSNDVDIESQNTGADGNVGVGLVNQMVTLVTGVTAVSNTDAPTTGGADLESDADLRDRAGSYIATMGKGTHTAIYNLAKSITGIRDAQVLDCEDLPATIDPGKCTVLLIGDAPLTLESEVFLAAEAAILSDANKPAGIEFTIQPATTVGLDLEISATLSIAAGADDTTVKNQAKTNIFAYVNSGYDSNYKYHDGLTIGDTLTVNQIIAHILQVDGIEDITTPFDVTETVNEEQHTFQTGTAAYDLDMLSNVATHGTGWDVTRIFAIVDDEEYDYHETADWTVAESTVGDHKKITVTWLGNDDPADDAVFYVDYWVIERDDVDPGDYKILTVTGVTFV